MNRITKITEYRLSSDWIEIFTEEFVVAEGEEIRTAAPKHLTPYINSPKDRLRIQEEQPECAIKMAFQAWGDTPTQEDPQPETPIEIPSEEQVEIEVEPVEDHESLSSEIVEEKPKRSRKKKTDEVPTEEEIENTEEQI